MKIFFFLATWILFFFPYIAFRILPFYSSEIDVVIAKYLDQMEYWLDTYFTPFAPVNPLKIVNNGIHFTKYFEKDSSNFFEGWYYKLVSSDGRATAVFIPGFFFEGHQNLLNDHTFVMSSLTLLDEDDKIIFKKVHRFIFPFQDIENEMVTQNSNSSEDNFYIKFLQNEFSQDGFKLSLQQEDAFINGSISFKDSKRYTGGLLAPNAIGFFTYIDALFGMQCVHKVVSKDAVITGELSYKFGEEVKNIDFTNGKAYIEGDYGSEFPEDYVWLQSNHFMTNPGSSVFLSFASVPIPNKKQELFSFLGFTGFVYDNAKDKTYRFGSFTGAKLTLLNVAGLKGLKQANEASVEIEDGQYKITLTAFGSRDEDKVSLFWAPKVVNGEFAMREYIEEMLDAQIQVIVKQKSSGKIIFEGIGLHAALEIQVA
eukprot:maker-scaffold_15-snap-gene-6.44-mRNA-1 protein AED:0.00 eAED:0.00 QI:94/1/1/1/1/1/2/162/425